MNIRPQVVQTAEPAASPTSTRDSQARRARKEARRRKQRNSDLMWLALALCTVLVLALALYGQQQKLQRVSQQLAQIRAGQAGQAGASTTALPAHASQGPGRLSSTAISLGSSDQDHSIAGLVEAAAQAGDCPRAGVSQLAFKRQFLAPIHYWSQTELKELRGQRVTYLFSGPDVATAAALFGATDHLIMVADQWVEALDETAGSAARQQAECRTLAHYSRFGYFRTNDLEGLGGSRPRFLHLLMHNMALADLSIEGAQYLTIDAEGQAQPVQVQPGRKAAGVRFHVRRRDGTQARIDYLRVDLSDTALQRTPAEREFLRKSLSEVVLLKSASHLLQEPMFSITAGLVSQHARSVVQDETGMHIGALQRHFDLRLYGDFADAHRLWSGKAAVQELRAFRASIGEAEPLYFTFGYEKPMGSLILVGTRRKEALKVAWNGSQLP
jgi:hypothetical protein